VITKSGKPQVGIEIKYGSDVRPSKGNSEAISTLQTIKNFVLVKDDVDYLLSNSMRVCGLSIFIKKYLPVI